MPTCPCAAIHNELSGWRVEGWCPNTSPWSGPGLGCVHPSQHGSRLTCWPMSLASIPVRPLHKCFWSCGQAPVAVQGHHSCWQTVRLMLLAGAGGSEGGSSGSRRVLVGCGTGTRATVLVRGVIGAHCNGWESQAKRSACPCTLGKRVAHSTRVAGPDEFGGRQYQGNRRPCGGAAVHVGIRHHAKKNAGRVERGELDGARSDSQSTWRSGLSGAAAAEAGGACKDCGPGGIFHNGSWGLDPAAAAAAASGWGAGSASRGIAGNRGPPRGIFHNGSEMSRSPRMVIITLNGPVV